MAGYTSDSERDSVSLPMGLVHCKSQLRSKDIDEYIPISETAESSKIPRNVEKFMMKVVSILRVIL